MTDPILHADIAVPAAMLRAAPAASLAPNQAVELVLRVWARDCESIARMNGTEPESVMRRLLGRAADLEERRKVRQSMAEIEAGEGLSPDEVRRELRRRHDERAGG